MSSTAHTADGLAGMAVWDPEPNGHARTRSPTRAAAAKPPDREAWARQDAALRPLVARMAADDEAALGDLYDLTVPRLYGLALRITRTPAAAEDVVAEVYHQAWRDARRFDPARGAVMTWLLTICRSRAIDSLRRRDEAECHPEPDTLWAPDASLADDPAGLLATFQSHSSLHQALAGLSAVQRQMIALAFFRGLSHQEIADHCSMPLGTVKTHLRKALERLRNVLTQDSPLSPEVSA